MLAAAAHSAVGSQLALAQRLGIDRTVMTYLIDDLEAAGLIERRPDPADRRARRVVATEQGAELLVTLDRRLRAAEATCSVHSTTRRARPSAHNFDCSPPDQCA